MTTMAPTTMAPTTMAPTTTAPTNVRWKILVLVTFASFVGYFLRSNVSIVGESMIDDLGLTEVHLGYMFSAFAAGYAMFQLPGGVMGNRFGARFLLTAMLLSWAILTALTGLIPGSSVLGVGSIVVSLVVLRFLVGATQAPLFPVSAGGTISNWFPVEGWGLPFGLQIAGYTLGAAAAAPVLVWLMESVGWRDALLISAPLGLISAGLWWWYARDLPIQHRSVNAAEVQLIDHNRPPLVEQSTPGAWKRALANRDILLLT
ncbi:MAG: ACS family glucarate transporter-like MFS transporter, partial [Halieaceae bacterium]